MIMTANDARELQQDTEKVLIQDFIFAEMCIRTACLDNRNSALFHCLHSAYIPGIIHQLEKSGFKCEHIEPDQIRIEW